MKAFTAVLILVGATVFSSVDAVESNVESFSSLQQRIRNALRGSVHNEAWAFDGVGGIENCPNKCNKVFDATQYSVQRDGSSTFEYSSCLIGCEVCSAAQERNDPDSAICYKTCKDTNFLSIPGQPTLVKGVVEPDKACIFGCIIQLCQGTCTGGTTDTTMTSANRRFFWPNGGCSVKTGLFGKDPAGFFSQNGKYTLFNNPSGAGGLSECCSNALSLCQFSGNRATTNFQNVLGQAQRFCRGTAAGNTEASICAYFNSGNCGTSPVDQ